ncbi:MAG: glutamine--fructose-6-phosphate transaminase (isomerizing) [Firmicutes bacterium]|nr:glutamine--fructose-6-phosphate transaminase (isomerizing) [Alicyclobacillaceae bacterium]MCL6497485.1 glutamine--fructose-6-phosphate transaminase (isomerizing) [Bacillota bacterium]
MCGIVGFVGSEADALPFLLEGLQRLEYRGYDSAGVAVVQPQGLAITKREGKLSRLAAALASAPVSGRCGIGHTRWATHGRPTDINAHPQVDCRQRIAVVHNGIIENFQPLRRELEAKGHRFRSDTDTEVIPHLLEEYGATEDLVEAVRRAEARLKGAYAFLAVAADHPDRIVAVRRSSPLVVGLGQGENYLASDFTAFLRRTRRALVLENGDVAVVTPEQVDISDGAGVPVKRPVLQIDWSLEQAERGGYAHFMLKEIMDQPQAWADCLLGRVEEGQVVVEALGLSRPRLEAVRRIKMVAAGTAYHAGLVGKALVEELARVPVDVEVASEFRYRHPLLEPGTLVVAISQSGETADTLASVALAKRLRVPVWAITNTVGSTLAREADAVAYTHAGPEIAVASTKAYTTQILVLTLFALALAAARGRPRPDLVSQLAGLPEAGSQLLESLAEAMAGYGQDLARHRDVFFIGRGLDWALAQEGQLKLKEISYLHAEAYAAGELKHGTLALIEDGVPVIALVTQPQLWEKTLSNILEVKARGACVWAVARADAPAIPADLRIAVPAFEPLLMPVLAAIPLQLLAYWTAVARGEDVDQPRNLAKSVTVE